MREVYGTASYTSLLDFDYLSQGARAKGKAGAGLGVLGTSSGPAGCGKAGTWNDNALGLLAGCGMDASWNGNCLACCWIGSSIRLCTSGLHVLVDDFLSGDHLSVVAGSWIIVLKYLW